MCPAGEAAIVYSKEYVFALLNDLEKHQVFPRQRFGKDPLID
jgi:hypothetical protein